MIDFIVIQVLVSTRLWPESCVLCRQQQTQEGQSFAPGLSVVKWGGGLRPYEVLTNCGSPYRERERILGKTVDLGVEDPKPVCIPDELQTMMSRSFDFHPRVKQMIAITVVHSE